jgi:hypothetical protein
MRVPREEWASTMQEFTDRNASRRTVLEVDSPDAGVQEEELEFPLKGVAYDPRDDRFEIMLGDGAGTTTHLTHEVARPRRVEIVRSTDYRDLALWITQDRGGTLLVLL